MFAAKTFLLGAFALLAAAQSDVLTFTRVPNPVTDGEPQAILYATNDTQSPVTIILRQGASNNLQTVQTLTTDATGGQYIWTPPVSLANGNDYALEIRQAGQNNYYGPFTVQGASPSAVASASSASAATSSSSSATGSMTTAVGGAGNATANSTMTATGSVSSGTGTTMTRNSTMSSPTLSHTRTTGGSGSGSGSSATSTGAGFEGTSSAAAPSSTGNAAPSDFTGKSTVAFVVGALAAVLYLH